MTWTLAGRVATIGGFACALMAGASLAAPADLDGRWGTEGVVVTQGPAGEFIGALVLQPDGFVIVAPGVYLEGAYLSRVVRVDVSGRRDASFGIGAQLSPPHPGQVATALALHRDGRIDVLWHRASMSTPSLYNCERTWARYLPSGGADTSFAQLGQRELAWDGCGHGLVLDGSGTSYRSESRYDAHSRTSSRWIERYSIDGTRLGDLSPFDDRWAYGELAIDVADRLVVGLHPTGAQQPGFAIGRVGRGTFGSGGIAFAPIAGTSYLHGVLALADGGVLAFGTRGDTDATANREAVVVRFDESGRPNGAFGASGVATLALSTSAEARVQSVQVAAEAGGRLVVVAQVSEGVDAQRTFPRIVVARLLPDGRPDPAFAGGGIADVWTGEVAQLQRSIAIRPTGEIIVPVHLGATASSAGEGAILQLRGGDLAAPHPLRERRVFEYFHAGYGHYFMTADLPEAAILDTSPALGWRSTGKTFNAWDAADVPLVPACRFWSGQRFAPKSSHFYTVYPDECAIVKQNPDWRFEGIAFHARMPEGTLGARTCPGGTQPLYRAYNNAVSGAPNHRYSTDPAVLEAMMAQGWTMEGEATTRVFACVPGQD